MSFRYFCVEEGLHVFLKHHQKKNILSKVKFKNTFVTGVAFNTELHSGKINLPEHQEESCSDPFTVLAHISLYCIVCPQYNRDRSQPTFQRRINVVSTL